MIKRLFLAALLVAGILGVAPSSPAQNKEKEISRASPAILALFRVKDTGHRTFVSEEEIKHLVTEGRAQGVLDQTEEELIHSVFEFAETPVKRVMVPRPNIFALDADTPPEEAERMMIESGFSPRAVSRVGAKGMWQFMEATGRRYGLKVDRWIDERLDPLKATVAAAQYLGDLYGMFGHWFLAQAAYNAGEARIARAIQRAKTSDFWALTQTRHLPNETKRFVPQILAATVINRAPARYGFDVVMEMSGHPGAFREALANMAHGASMAVLGIPSEEIPLDVSRIVFDQLTIRGIYGREMYETWYKMSVLLRSGLDISPVITHRFDHRDHEAAFAAARSGDSGKVIMDWTA